MPSKVSIHPKLFYDSVMKDTFPADCMRSIEKHRRKKPNQPANQPKKPSQFNLTICILNFSGRTEKAEK